ARDLDPAVLQIVGYRRDLPLRLADLTRLAQEVGPLTRVEPALTQLAGHQQVAPPGSAAKLQLRYESQRIGCQDVGRLGRDIGQDFDATRASGDLGCVHDWVSSIWEAIRSVRVRCFTPVSNRVVEQTRIEYDNLFNG